MKRMKVLLLLLAVAGAVSMAMAYEPIVKENKQWVYYRLHIRNIPQNWPQVDTLFYPCVYEFKGDTVVDGFTYKKLWRDYAYTEVVSPAPGQPHEIVPRHEHGVVMLVRELAEFVYARRVGSHRPLVGHEGAATPLHQDIGPEYNIFKPTMLKDIQPWFDSTPLTKKQREEMFTFTDMDFITINGTQRRRHIASYPNRYLIEGIGYVRTAADLDSNPTSFIDLEPAHWLFMLSHVTEDGEIIFKTDDYDFIRSMGRIYDPDAPEGGGDVPSGVSELPVDGGATAAGGRTYDMQGRAVTGPLQPGIYVRDGQKLLVE